MIRAMGILSRPEGDAWERQITGFDSSSLESTQRDRPKACSDRWLGRAFDPPRPDGAGRKRGQLKRALGLLQRASRAATPLARVVRHRASLCVLSPNAAPA